MAKGKKTGGRNFQKGHSISRPPLPIEVIEARKLNKAEAEITLNKFLHMSFYEMESFLNNHSNQVHELLVARVLFEAIKNGDHMKLEWVYYRLFGKQNEIKSAEGILTKDDILLKWSKIDPRDHIALLKQPPPKEGND